MVETLAKPENRTRVRGPARLKSFAHVSVPCRDPSGNLIELFCEQGFAGAQELPHGPPRGHGIAVDIDTLRYTQWHLPED